MYGFCLIRTQNVACLLSIHLGRTESTTAFLKINHSHIKGYFRLYESPLGRTFRSIKYLIAILSTRRLTKDLKDTQGNALCKAPDIITEQRMLNCSLLSLICSLTLGAGARHKAVSW